MTYLFRNILLGSLLCALVAGCGQRVPTNLHPVMGKVSYESKPFTNVRVYMIAEDQVSAKPQYLPSGVTNDEGKFTLGYSPEKQGAPMGKYIVFLSPLDPNDTPGMDDEPLPLVPDDVQSAATSPLRFEVKTGQNQLEIDLTPELIVVK